MSDIKSIGEQISKISTDSSTDASNLYGLAKNLRRTLDMVRHLLQSTARDDYRVIIEQFTNALEKMTNAADNLMYVSSIAKEWMGLHISGGTNSNYNANTFENAHREFLASEFPRPQVLTRDPDEAIESGMRAINAQMDLVREDCLDKGITDHNKIEEIVAQKRETAEIEFYNDLFGKVDEKIIDAFNRLSPFFSEEMWNNLNQHEREDALNTLAIDVGKAYRTSINGVVFYEGPVNSRGYYKSDGFLYINADCLTDPNNRLDALDTIFHEGRHAFQREAINDPHKYGITNEQANIWKDNFAHYLREERFGYDPYYNQPVELDAFTFADHIIKKGAIV